MEKAHLASQRLKGSALALGMDWIKRKMPCVFQHWSFCRPPAVSNASARGHPPLAVQAQVGIAPAHLLPIVRRIGGIRQGGNDVGDDKPPFVVMQGAADGLLLKHGDSETVTASSHQETRTPAQRSSPATDPAPEYRQRRASAARSRRPPVSRHHHLPSRYAPAME